jgi:hypothetical protein
LEKTSGQHYFHSLRFPGIAKCDFWYLWLLGIAGVEGSNTFSLADPGKLPSAPYMLRINVESNPIVEKLLKQSFEV